MLKRLTKKYFFPRKKPTNKNLSVWWLDETNIMHPMNNGG